ncbi:FAD-binding oxidoreductase [Actinoplanes sp. NPDC049265]|uniref:FAD-binding oxidoreductase n=1 Tax=Actinoplanes sp. NPDC049265 TaxID=3363902 RepID=UPI003711B5F5
MGGIAAIAGSAAFTGTFKGEVITPEVPEYEDARLIWNRDFDRRPRVIVRPVDTDDVVAAVRFARDNDLLVAVRSGGHSYPGHSTCDDGMVIDLGRMNRIRLDPETGIVRAQAGVLLRDVDSATAVHGLVLPAGIVSHTGLAGLALGGGIGYLTRSFGLTCDQFVRLRVVTAAGDVVTASATENEDLFWGLKGGGGNFGIVTEFECRTHVLGNVQGGQLYFPMSQAVDVILGLGEIMEHAPREMCVSHGLAVNPAFTPAADESEWLLAVNVVYRGEPGDEPLREVTGFAKPVHNSIGPANFLEAQQRFDNASGHGTGWYMKSGHTRELSSSLVESFVQHSLDHLEIASPNVLQEVFSLHSIGGAAGDVAEDDTAYSGRAAQWHCSIEVGFTKPQERERVVGWTRRAWETTRQHLDMTTSYVNMMFQDGSGSLADVYGDAKLQRLRQVKTAWDPQNFFRLNSNIKPLGGDQLDG